MNQSDFEADLLREGYQVFYGGLKAGELNADPSHDWDARVMVIGGEITLTVEARLKRFVQVTVARSLPARCTPNMSARKESRMSLDAAPLLPEIQPVRSSNKARS